MITCTVCGAIIGYDEQFIQTESKEEVCMDIECRTKYMLENITLTELDEILYGDDWKDLREKVRTGGLEALKANTEDLDAVPEAYESSFTICDNDEADAALLAEWAADRKYQDQEYYRMVRPA